jgi:hypothetical protein
MQSSTSANRQLLQEGRRKSHCIDELVGIATSMFVKLWLTDLDPPFTTPFAGLDRHLAKEQE